MKITNKEYLKFLSNIDLESYRLRFRPYMSVEENLPKEVQIIDFIYEYYWEKRDLISFDKFIDIVIKNKENNLKDYNRKRNGYDKDADLVYPLFLKGWIARQYRTWASIITQIQLGYLYEEIFPEDTVIMSASLDHDGIDMRVVGKKDYGVKKVSKRGDVNIKTKEKKGVVPIKYWVPQIKDLKNPYKKNGEYRVGYKAFIEDGRLDFFDNGFIVFNENVFKNVK